jgi:hypothetical protein
MLIKDWRLQFYPLIYFDNTSTAPNSGAFSFLNYLEALSFFYLLLRIIRGKSNQISIGLTMVGLTIFIMVRDPIIVPT